MQPWTVFFFEVVFVLKRWPFLYDLERVVYRIEVNLNTGFIPYIIYTILTCLSP